jgi:integrase/recombinase XerD
MTALKTLWTWAYSQGFVELNPAMIPMPEYTRERREEITLQEFEQIMSSLDDSFPKELRDKAIISFFCITGVRLGEFLEINLSKMDFQERMVEVKTFKRKNHRRKVYWDNRTNELLFKWLDMREKIIGRGKREHDALFVSLDPTTYGEPLGRCAIQRVFKCAREKCGIKKQISPHSCRHGFATNAVRKGVNPVFLKEMLGHANMQNTMIYVHSEDKEIRDEHRRVFDS